MLTDVFLEQELENQDDVERFCKVYEVKLLFQGMTETNHPGIYEPTYTFSDGLGYYTIKGIRKAVVGG